MLENEQHKIFDDGEIQRGKNFETKPVTFTTDSSRNIQQFQIFTHQDPLSQSHNLLA